MTGPSSVPAEPAGDRRGADPSATSADASIDEHLRLVTHVDGATTEVAGRAAIAAIPEAITPGSGFAWVDLTDPSPEQIARIAGHLGLHPLIAEDITEGNQRAKLEITDDLVHVVLFALEYRDGIIAHEVDIVLAPRFLLTVHPTGWDPRAAPHFRSGVGAILTHGPDHLLWAIADAIVDGYFPFTDRLGDAIDELQDEVVAGANRAVMTRLFVLKRELIEVRRAVSPVREVFNQLTNRDLAVIDENEIVYFRDVYDHVIRLTEELDTDRELIATTLEVHLSRVNNDLSLIMKRLTGVTVIIAGIGAIAGIFGMSEAGAAFRGAEAVGFWVVAGLTGGLSIAAAWVLHRLDWI